MIIKVIFSGKSMSWLFSNVVLPIFFIFFFLLFLLLKSFGLMVRQWKRCESISIFCHFTNQAMNQLSSLLKKVMT